MNPVSQVLSPELTLDDAVATQVGLGLEDPVEIAQKVIGLHGESWVARELAGRSVELLANIARAQVRSATRSAENALREGDPVTTSELKLRKYWIPEVGWKSAAQLTSDDLRARAGFYEQLAGAALMRAAWCREVADMIDAAGVKKLGALKETLPPLGGAVEIAA